MKIFGTFTSDNLPKGCTWMQLPTPRVIDESHVQVYFATRVSGKSHVGFCILELNENKRRFDLVEMFNHFCIEPGPTGTYSQDGIHPSSIAIRDGKITLYTIGWIEGRVPPLFSASIGIAESEDGRFFTDKFNSPILDRGLHDPTLASSPCVIPGKNTGFEMYYTSGTEWVQNLNGSLDSRYHIKKCYSLDGENWERNGEIAIDFWDSVTNVARPAHFKIDGNEAMFFSYATTSLKSYQLGFASFANGQWNVDLSSPKLDKIDPLSCAAYPAVFSFGPRNFLLINGIDRGKSGFSVYEL